MKRCLCLFLLIFLSSTLCAQEIIIESRRDGLNFSGYSEIKGNWLDSIAKSTAPGCSFEAGSRFITIDSKQDAEARFTPDIPKAGEYDIYITWGRSGNALGVKIQVNTGSQKVDKVIDMAGWGGSVPENANIWHHLGTFDLPSGKKAHVSLQTSEVTGSADSMNSGRVYADAVKITPKGFVPPATAASTPPAPASTPNIPSPQPVPVTAAATPGATTSTPATTSSSPGVPFVAIGSQTAPGTTPAPYTPPATTPVPIIPVTPGTQEPVWMTNYTEAVQAGMASGKSILLFFHSSRAAASLQMENDVLGDPEVKKRLINFICCKLEVRESPNVADYYGIFKAPVLYFLDSRGYSRARIDNLVTPTALLQELDKFK